MKKIQTEASNKTPYSKGFTEGINTLYDEIQLAFQWHRPSILLAIHNTSGGQLIAQQFLEKKILKAKRTVQHIRPQNNTPDVIGSICAAPNPEKNVFFISALDNVNQLSNGEVYRALNIHREHLVEHKICAVFWLTETEATNLPRFAPDFWAFRHRVVEFALQRGSRNPSVPSGLFLWKEQLPWMGPNVLYKQTAYYDDFLSKLPNEDSATTTRLDATLKLIHLNWQLNNLERFTKYFESMLVLLKTRSNLQYHGWALNAKGIKLFEDGDKQGAQTCFGQALAIEPHNSIFMINSAIAAHGTGKNRDALLIAQRAIKIDSGNSRLWNVLGFLYLAMGKPQNAVEAMETALKKQPDNVETQYSLAICCLKNNQPEACAAWLAKIEKGSTHQNILQTACQDILSGNMEEAFAVLHQAFKSEEINQHQLVQDPNLRALVDVQRLMSISE